MKAAIVERPGQITVRDIPEPELATEYDARCEILYSAVCTGTDHHLVHGNFPWPVEYPTILGHEAIGRVVEIGPKVRHLKLGDVVTRVGTTPADDLAVNWGGFAEYGVARDHRAMQEDGEPAELWSNYRINQVVPPDIDPAASTMMITWRETLSYITRLGVTVGSRVLVLGSGGNGLAFVAHAHNLGAEIVALSGSANRSELAGGIGATHFYNYRQNDWKTQAAQLAPEGFDFIIDAVGKAEQMNEALALLRFGGTIGIYGLDDWNSLTLKPSAARGTFTFYGGGYDEAETHEQVVAFMRAGKLDAKHWLNLDSPYALENIQDAFDALANRQLVKALIQIAGR